ncbi:hypothetical protein CL91_gp05 [Mycobacterium phage Aeneas]|uniref:Uncharacterized protein n=2 Tax=Fromanvirus TaxID=186764 RepID=I3WX76_9CAUD|nr:hypothetical protein CL67_gp05 [Mycobacterium phage Perseus]YP_009016270.1 hypothetical protein CL91_gp05 [Mycobacterium phage Aeneas]AEM91725.1 hypothetical protein PERSEUS_5 [Mycobacterium phage Perseus]AFL48104.1 hypothetical protein AENEAS_5 [Mycobacterium phage Aeneas]
MLPQRFPTVVVSSTVQKARSLADALGLRDYYPYAADQRIFFEGARADRAVIDADADVPEDFMEDLYCTVQILFQGSISRVSVKTVT